MSLNTPPELTQFIDDERYSRAIAIPETHFYGVNLLSEKKSPVFHARYSPRGERPLVIVVDSKGKTFFCSCQEFQKRALYPARLGLYLCDHLIRALTLIDPATRRLLKIDKGAWTCLKATQDFERRQLLAQTEHYFEIGDLMGALNEMYFGVYGALLRDMDVADLLERIAPDSIVDDDLPEALRFIKVLLQRGFTRKAAAVAQSWLERFSLNVDRYAPFGDVAPVALWLKRSFATPDVQFATIRENVIKALEVAKKNAEPKASWWLLFRSVSRSGVEPPKSCVDVWKGQLEQMRLSLVHPDRIEDAVKLLADFGIQVPRPDSNYVRMHAQSLQRSRQWRMNYLLQLADAFHLEPVLEVTVNSYLSHEYVGMEKIGPSRPEHDMILTAVGFKQSSLSTDLFAENWPIIRRLTRDMPKLDDTIRKAVIRAWPQEPDGALAKPVGQIKQSAVSATDEMFVVRWSLAEPKLVANSPLVSHRERRIYIPARGASKWPEAFGLALCAQSVAVGRRLFTLQILRTLDAAQAVECLEQGARFIGPQSDPVWLLARPLDSLPIEQLLDMPAKLAEARARMDLASWLPDRTFIAKQIPRRTARLAAFLKVAIHKSLAQNRKPPVGTDIGFLFGRGLALRANAGLLKVLAKHAAKCETVQQWIAAVSPEVVKRLPLMDRPADPIDVELMADTTLAPAIEPIVKARKKALASVRLVAKGGFIDLADLKKTVYGKMLLNSLKLGRRAKIRKSEADELLNSLSKLKLGVEGLPLFQSKTD